MRLVAGKLLTKKSCKLQNYSNVVNLTTNLFNSISFDQKKKYIQKMYNITNHPQNT